MEALIVVDVQNDFCPGGALAVPDGDQVVEPINELAERIPFVVATRDWHPPGHSSFAEQGGPWPVHCLRDSPGAELHAGIRRLPVRFGAWFGAGFRIVGRGTLFIDRPLPVSVQNVRPIGRASEAVAAPFVHDALDPR